MFRMELRVLEGPLLSAQARVGELARLLRLTLRHRRGDNTFYRRGYTARQLNRWAHRLAEQTQTGHAVFVYFNNDPEAVAVANAMALKRALDRLLQ
jgi:uncharacterized protein YecE (DUF72 family)